MSLNGHKLKRFAKRKWQEYKQEQRERKAYRKEVRAAEKEAHRKAYKEEAVKVARQRARVSAREPRGWRAIGMGLGTGFGAMGRGAVRMTGGIMGEPRFKARVKTKYEYKPKIVWKKVGKHYVKKTKYIKKKIKVRKPREREFRSKVADPFAQMRQSFSQI